MFSSCPTSHVAQSKCNPWAPSSLLTLSLMPTLRNFFSRAFLARASLCSRTSLRAPSNCLKFAVVMQSQSSHNACTVSGLKCHYIEVEWQKRLGNGQLTDWPIDGLPGLWSWRCSPGRRGRVEVCFLPGCAVPVLFGKPDSPYMLRGSSSSVERSLSMREVQGSTPWSSKRSFFCPLLSFFLSCDALSKLSVTANPVWTDLRVT